MSVLRTSPFRRPTLIVMLKEPRAGRVKTRLGGDIGMTCAAWWFRHQTQALLRRLRDPRWQLVLAIAPDNALNTRSFPTDLPRLPQGPGDLGARMARLLRGHTAPVALIGGDIPGIKKHHIAQAYRNLGRYDAVFGPAMDGGYWMIGAKPGPLPPQFLQNVRWSTRHALADSIATLGASRIALGETLRDVDTAADLCA